VFAESLGRAGGAPHARRDIAAPLAGDRDRGPEPGRDA
jgi:hypothetical protein